MQSQKYLEHLKEILNDTGHEDQKTPTKEDLRMIEMKRQPLSQASPSTKIDNIKKKNIANNDEKVKDNVSKQREIKDKNTSICQKEEKKMLGKKMQKNVSPKVKDDEKPKENEMFSIGYSLRMKTIKTFR